MRAFMREDRYPRLREIALPTAVIVGEYDRTTPRSHAQRLAAGIPKATLTIVPNAGHCLNWETDGPATLIEAIESMPHS